MDKQETLMIAVVFVAVFALAFSFSSWVNGQNVYLYNFRVTASKPPITAIKGVLEQNHSLILRQDLFNGSTRENSAIAAASAELVYASLATGITIYNYGVVNGVPLNNTCNSNNSMCGVPDITIRIDSSTAPCNCITVYDNNTMDIAASADFFLTNAPDLRRIVYASRARG